LQCEGGIFLGIAGTPRYVEGTFVGGVKFLPVRFTMK